MNRYLAFATLALVAMLPASATIDGTGPNTWISVGIPYQTHQGTLGAPPATGDFYLTGTDHGRCNNVRPDYFRFDMSQPHWKEMYAGLLYAAANEKPIDCVVDSGCGTTQVWVSSCRIPLR